MTPQLRETIPQAEKGKRAAGTKPAAGGTFEHACKRELVGLAEWRYGACPSPPPGATSFAETYQPGSVRARFSEQYDSPQAFEAVC